MSIQKNRTLFLGWDILFFIMVIITYIRPSLVLPFFVANGAVLGVLYMICNNNIRKSIEKYRLENPDAMDIDGNLRYHRSAHPEIKKYIDERNSLTLYALINIALALGLMVNV